MQAALRAALIPTLTPTPTPTLALTLTLTPTPTLTLTLTLTRRYVHLISTHLGEGGREGGGKGGKDSHGKGGKDLHGKGGKDLHGKGGKEGAPVEALGFRAACAALSPEARAARQRLGHHVLCTTYHLPSAEHRPAYHLINLLTYTLLPRCAPSYRPNPNPNPNPKPNPNPDPDPNPKVRAELQTIED